MPKMSFSHRKHFIISILDLDLAVQADMIQFHDVLISMVVTCVIEDKGCTVYYCTYSGRVVGWKVLFPFTYPVDRQPTTIEAHSQIHTVVQYCTQLQ